ncbi:MAG TPA: phosphate regulon sensor histidine kinase PhoR [Rhodanobacteraceae bacterium]|nr:phosphate regulon sensor histidine kinase PhoR [Rhodanobacteraceae bacterium]
MTSRLARSWRTLLWGAGLAFAAAVAVGWWLHAIAACVLAVAAACLAWCACNLARFGRWLESGRRRPDRSSGLWSDLQELVARRRHAAFAGKRQLVGLLRAFRDAAAALPDAVVALDGEHRIQWFNAAARTLLGLAYPQDIGGHVTNLLRAPRIIEWLRGGGLDPLSDVPSPGNENVRLNLKLIRYADDRRLLIARDVSQLMRLEQVRRDFVANVSHELRTPLTVVHGYLDLIEPAEMQEYEPILRELRDQSRRMMQIVEDLLMLSRLEAQNAIPSERVGMRALLEALRREAVALSMGRHAITIECRGTHDLRGSLKDLHSAFSNLVSNAVRYTPPDGRITLRWESDASGGRLSVTDTGQGIPAQHLPRLTERFYRVSTSRSRETGGTGLGLSIVKHVLQLHQARLEIASELGVGSTFTCVFGPERLLDAQALADVS